MATFNGNTKKIADLSAVAAYDLDDNLIIHDGNGLKKSLAKYLLAQHLFGTVETDATKASRAYDAGECLVLEGKLYRATTAIEKDGALTVDTNIKERTLSELLKPFNFDNAGFHNSIYRGKFLGTSFTAEQQAAVAAGTFDDMFIGDYWEMDGITYRIAGFDYWYGFGDTQGVGVCYTHHIVIVPDQNMLVADGSTTRFMNTSNITDGAYVGSGFYSGTNADTTSNTSKAQCLAKAKAAFGNSHILTHREHLQNAVTKPSSGVAYSSGGAWYDSDIEIMNEIMVYGSKIFGDVEAPGTAVPNLYTIANGQLPLFALNHHHICNRASWWLRDVVSATYFANVGYTGNANCIGASYGNIGVRPAFGIS